MCRNGLVSFLALVASACTPMPVPDDGAGERTLSAPYPRLLTVDEMALIGTDSGDIPEDFNRIERRADALRAKAAETRDLVPDRQAREDPPSAAERHNRQRIDPPRNSR